MENKKSFNMDPEDRKTVDVIKLLMPMKARPGMYLGSKSYERLMIFLAGYARGTNLYENSEVISWSNIQQDVWQRIEEHYTYQNWNNELPDDGKFDIYIDMIFAVFAEKYPEHARDLGISN